MADYIKVDGKDIGNIKMFALSTCGWCKKAKKYLNDHGVKYSYIDVDLLPLEELESVRAEQMKFNPQGSFPTIVVNEKDCIAGYDEEKLNAIIGE